MPAPGPMQAQWCAHMTAHSPAAAAHIREHALAGSAHDDDDEQKKKEERGMEQS
eukprot:CAMPEP_0202887752 /NCGR_PEP_ID=MMETSP1391-20130828/42845_1 /ASSEMBLY_ACC=CAM_ASM_000867 /TAXON_ID=1034604 /ORGANISM="Chlamydomonas leiostraca, Strain SAG 11-49" /LENGTH=53 /DNA_ID=CAMNT_0049571049 /DNA_START=618 /DNA_END=779 /DNA_ORIENTATION=+